MSTTICPTCGRALEGRVVKDGRTTKTIVPPHRRKEGVKGLCFGTGKTARTGRPTTLIEK